MKRLALVAAVAASAFLVNVPAPMTGARTDGDVAVCVYGFRSGAPTALPSSWTADPSIACPKGN